jgi:hypothetical protein
MLLIDQIIVYNIGHLVYIRIILFNNLIKMYIGSSVGTTVAGSTGNSGPWSYQFTNPTSITIDTYGYIYIMDFGNSRVQKWYPGGVYGTTVASATMSNPYGMNMDTMGNIYVADTSYQRILLFAVTCRKLLNASKNLQSSLFERIFSVNIN